MTTFSVPQDYSLTSSDTITLTSTTGNISYNGLSTVTIPTSYSSNTINVGNICSASSNTINIGSICGGAGTYSTFDISSIWGEEWVNGFPQWDRIQEMCKEYPGLAIAFEKFKTTYLLVKNHYDTPEDQRPKP